MSSPEMSSRRRPKHGQAHAQRCGAWQGLRVVALACWDAAERDGVRVLRWLARRRRHGRRRGATAMVGNGAMARERRNREREMTMGLTTVLAESTTISREVGCEQNGEGDLQWSEVKTTSMAALVGVLGMGVPRLACLRPAAWLQEWPSMAHLHQHMLNTLARGQASRGGRQEASSGTASSGWLARRRRDQGGGTSRGAHDTRHDDQDQAGARWAPACAESLFPLWCKGGKRRREYQAKATISVQQDQDQQNGRMEVIVDPKTASPPESLAGEDQL